MPIIILILILDILVILDIMKIKNPSERTSYILCILLIPIGGILIYYLSHKRKRRRFLDKKI